MKKSEVDKEVDAAMALSEDIEASDATTITAVEEDAVLVFDDSTDEFRPVSMGVTASDSTSVTSIQEAIDERLGEFFKGKQLEDGMKEEFRREMQEVAYGLRKYFKEEIEKMSKQMKSDFMEELKRL